jgi:predicted regulator of Ras-like GTPase activity (Roadblock/LC7/MglB family)
MVEPAITLFGGAYQKASQVLEELLHQSGARFVLLLDRKGFVLAHREALWAPRPFALDSLATLVAGNAAATQALARMLGELRFSELLLQGSTYGMYAEEVGDLALLVIIFDNSAPVGRVKLYGKRAVQSLEVITKDSVVSTGTFGIDSEYRDGATALLDELFGN